MNRTYLRLFRACLGLVPATLAAGTLDTLQPPPANAELRRLDNGLEVLLLRLPSTPMVSMNVQVKAGSAKESFRTSGMSHMLEHLLFNGSEELSQQELYDAADRIGAYNNANTSRFYTNYTMLVPVEQIAEGMHLQSQMLFHSILPPEKFEKERGIVIEEIIQGADDPHGGEIEAWEEFLFTDSSFELPTLGTLSTIRHMEREAVLDYYRTWYVPNNMMLSVVGGFDPATVRELIERYYGEASPGELPKGDFRPLAFEPGACRVRNADLQQPLLRLAWPAPDMLDPEYHAAQLLAWAAGDPRDGVLPALVFSAGLPPLRKIEFSHDGTPGFGRFELSLEIPEGLDPAAALEGLRAVADRLAEHEFDPRKLAQRVTGERTATALLLEKPHYLGMMQAEAFVHRGFDWVLAQDRLLAGVEAADLRLVAEQWLRERAPMSMLLLPATDKEAERRTDGGELYYRPSDTGPTLIIDDASSSGVFALQAVTRGRSLWEGPQQAGALNLLHHLMLEGAGELDAVAIRRRLRELGAKLTLHDDPAIPWDDHYTSPGHAFLRIEVLAEHYRGACELVARMLRAPRIEGPALEEQRGDLLRQLEREKQSARRLSKRLLNRELLGDHPAALPPAGTPESLARLDEESLRRIHGLAYRPENIILSMVGPVPAADLQALWDELLPPGPLDEADLEYFRSRVPWASAAEVSPDLPFRAPDPPVPETETSRELREVLGGEMSVIRLGSVFGSRPEDAAALRVLFALISDRLAFDLREERGWAYSIGCWVSSRAGQSTAGAYMGTRGENLDQALPALRAYLRDFDARSLAQAELDKVRGSLLGRGLMRRLASINQARYRALGELEGDLEAPARRVEALRDVELEDLKRVARKYLKHINWITVVVE